MVFLCPISGILIQVGHNVSQKGRCFMSNKKEDKFEWNDPKYAMETLYTDQINK